MVRLACDVALEAADDLWLGLAADLALKQRTLDRITAPNGQPGRYRAADAMLAFLDSL